MFITTANVLTNPAPSKTDEVIEFPDTDKKRSPRLRVDPVNRRHMVSRLTS
jgi:hypothetical protein